MRPDQIIVAAVAAAVGSLATLAALQVWTAPYRLRSIAALESRFGRNAARWFLVLIALLLFGIAYAVAIDLRPGYATMSAFPAAIQVGIGGRLALQDRCVKLSAAATTTSGDVFLSVHFLQIGPRHDLLPSRLVDRFCRRIGK